MRIRQNKITIKIIYILLSIMFVMLQGCSSGYAPVSDRSGVLDNKVELVRSSRHKSAAAPASYRVKRGDTLYSISWRYGLDYRELARINNIDQNFRINTGQVLRLNKRRASVKAVEKPDPTPGPEQIIPKAAGDTRKVRQPLSIVKPSSSSVAMATQDVIWQWPAGGKIISDYSAKGNVNKGINLEGKQGESVYAAATGKVVYAGSGLLGYGNLIIINHNHEYLSAYAHNSKIFVKENENVNVGAKVAEIGNSGATRMMLHFEIRKDGKPVNPLRYLPKR